jgi:hypothetical protein
MPGNIHTGNDRVLCHYHDQDSAMKILKRNPLIEKIFRTTAHRKWWQFWKPEYWQTESTDAYDSVEDYEDENTEQGAAKLYRALEESMKK